MPSESPVNGNGAAHQPAAAVEGPKENIFLFWPNIIGTMMLCARRRVPAVVEEPLVDRG